MGRRNHDRRPAPAPRAWDALGFLDDELGVRRDRFEDAVAVGDVAADEPPDAPPGRAAVLRFGDRELDLSGVLDWLAPLAGAGAWTFYLHHHDNLVVELARFEPYRRAAFRRCLRLFRTRPAAEGGSNLLGVAGPGGAWALVLDSDNQGHFRADFFGPADACRDLRSYLGGSAGE